MAKEECHLGDRLHIGPDRGDGVHHCIRHTPDHEVKHGFVKPVKDGEPLNDGSSLVSIKYDSRVGDFEVTPIYEPRSEGKSGPAMVASNEYRSGWDRIFGSKATVGSA